MSLHCYRCSIKLKLNEIYYSDAPNIIYHWKCYIAYMNELFQMNEIKEFHEEAGVGKDLFRWQAELYAISVARRVRQCEG